MTTPKLKIYDVAGFPNPMRVRVALAEKGLTDQVEFVPVDLMAGEHRTPAFRAKNPSAAVPVLELADGACISECSAITEYLDQIDGAPTLTGRTPQERAEIAMLQRKAEAEVFDAVSDYFHNATPGLGPDLEVEQIPAYGEKQRRRAEAGLARFDGILAERPYLAGAFSVADITLAAALAFADLAKIDIPAKLTHLNAWRERVTSRPSFA